MEVEESRYREWQIYSKETVSTPIIIRLDGNDFHKLQFLRGFRKPFDKRFHLAMVNVVKELMKKTEFKASIAYTASDEINLFFPKKFSLPHNGRVEKLLSLSSAYATSSFQNHVRVILPYKEPLSFDSRIIKFNSDKDVLDYIQWRAIISFRNFLNAYCQIFIGKKECLGMKGKQVVRQLYNRGINVNKTPAWERYGTLIYWKIVEKTGYNPITGEEVRVQRKKVTHKTFDITNLNGRLLLQEFIFPATP